MPFIPKPHEIYKHFKGNLYQVTTVAEHTETGETLVIYQALYGDFKSYARPLSMFTGRVDRVKYPDAEQEYRFQLQGPEAERQKAESEEQAAGSGNGFGGQSAEAAAGFGGPAEAGQTRAEQRAAAVWEDVQNPEEEEPVLDPMLLEFLDSDSYEQKLNILAGLHHRITDDMITTMAISCDIEINDGELEERYDALKGCLLTLEHYECNRLR